MVSLQVIVHPVNQKARLHLKITQKVQVVLVEYLEAHKVIAQVLKA